MMIELSVIRDLVAIFGVIAGFSYYVLTVRNNQRNQRQQLETRQAQLFMNLFNTFASKEYQKDKEQMTTVWEWKDYDDFFAKYGPDINPDDHAIWDMNLQWMEGVGVLVRRGLIDPKLVYDIMYGSIIAFWEKHETIIQGLRERSTMPQTLSDLEYIYRQMEAIREKRRTQKPIS